MPNAGLNWPSTLPKLLWNKRECPLCSSVEFEEAESGSLDSPLGLFSLRPVRCRNCFRRYYWFAKRVKRAT